MAVEEALRFPLPKGISTHSFALISDKKVAANNIALFLVSDMPFSLPAVQPI